MVVAYFNRKYRSEDPYRTSEAKWQARKYDYVIGLIGSNGFRHALDIGSGEGHFAAKLALLGNDTTGIDISKRAVERASKRYAHNSSVHFRVLDIVGDNLHETFDLITCMEVLYYLLPDQLNKACEKIVSWLEPNGKLILVHTYSGKSTLAGWYQQPYGVDELHAIFTSRTDLRTLQDIHTQRHQITMLERASR